MTPSAPPAEGEAPAGWRSWHRPLLLAAAVMVPAAVVSAVGLLVDDRVLLDAPIWLKPFKFSLSFAAFCLTLAWMVSFVPRRRRLVWWAGTVVGAGSVIEIVIISGQAARGRRSHFNYATPLDETLYNVMGGTVILLWLATLTLAVLLVRARLADRASAWAMRCGIVLALAGTAVGFLMDRPAPGQKTGVTDVVGAHSIGVPDGGPGMALTGWSTAGGDLRVPHFFGMHALQLLPLLVLLLGLLAPRFARLADDRLRLRLVLVAAGAYAAVFALILWQALRGQALLDPDGTTLAAAGLILAATAAGALAALRSGSREPAS
ncbi:hypothetical protein ACIP27_04415 [Streptomyces hydrogenans]|uniref:hypothetical protein n=3 Tax=Streptomyces hydrogenans TaxID=1873719 RepID=UPI0037FF52B9